VVAHPRSERPAKRPESVNGGTSDDFDHNPGIQFRQHRVFRGDEVAGNPAAGCVTGLADSRVRWTANCGLALWHYHKPIGPEKSK
jgi:hypothetical protein